MRNNKACAELRDEHRQLALDYEAAQTQAERKDILEALNEVLDILFRRGCSA